MPRHDCPDASASISRGPGAIDANGKLIVLASSDLKAENSLEQPTHVAPVEKPLASAASGFELALDPQSFTVLRARYGAASR